MVTLVVHHVVEDYDRWKQVFDGHEGVRRGHGEVEHRVYRNTSEPNRVVVHNDFSSVAAAEGFRDDPSLADAMSRAGVVGEPGIGIVRMVDRKPYVAGDVGFTLVVHHPVADYDAWKPVFDAHEDVRRAHGALEHRIFRVPGDERSVVVHLDFPAESDADAFLADPSLREAMERGGVEGQPGLNRILCAEQKVYG